MDKQHVLKQINAIYENCKEHMENTEEDWDKAFGAFRKLLKKYGNDAWVNQEIQKVILKLEDHVRVKYSNQSIKDEIGLELSIRENL